MLPTLETTVGSLHVVVSLYGVALGLAVATGLVLAVRRAHQPDVVLVVAPFVVLAGMQGAAALYRLLDRGAGLASVGGVGAGLTVIALAARAGGVRTRDLLDAIAPAALVGFAMGRVGCFLAGCCYGRPTDLPWGVVIPALGPPPRHPVQLYAAAIDLALGRWALRARPGDAAPRAVVGYGAARIVLELFRDPAATDALGASGITVPQAFGLALLLAGLEMWRAPRQPHSAPSSGSGRK